MTIKAVGFRLLVKPDEVLKKSAGGIDLSALNETMERNAQTTGVILEIGEDAFVAFKPKTETWGLKIGDKVHFPRYSGKWVRDTNTLEELLVINDEDVIAKEV